jgi:hypothetical protein
VRGIRVLLRSFNASISYPYIWTQSGAARTRCTAKCRSGRISPQPFSSAGSCLPRASIFTQGPRRSVHLYTNAPNRPMDCVTERHQKTVRLFCETYLPLIRPTRGRHIGSFSNDFSWILVIPECDELDVTDVVRIGPFQELKIRHKLRFHPDALLHFWGGQSLSPPSALLFWKVRKRTLLNDPHLQACVQITPSCGNQSRPYTCGIHQ